MERFSTCDFGFFLGRNASLQVLRYLEFVSAWLTFSGLVVLRWMFYLDNYLISWENFPVMSFSVARSHSFFLFSYLGKVQFLHMHSSTSALRFVTDPFAVIWDASVFSWWALWYPAQEVTSLPRHSALKAAAVCTLWGSLFLSRSPTAGYWAGSTRLQFGTFFFFPIYRFYFCICHRHFHT